MKDRIFIDTNILVYACTDGDAAKHEKAREFLSKCFKSDVFISTQVLCELYNALKKSGADNKTAAYALDSFSSTMCVLPVTHETVRSCMALIGKYGYSIWDSLIISAALSAGCGVLCSEDVSNKQIINGQLRIHNPFL